MHPAISLMLRDPRTLAAIERALAKRGQHGDTMIAHINPAEAQLLRRLGGAGTINPKTGLRQFYGDDAGGPSTHDAPGGGSGLGGGQGGGTNRGGDGGYNGQGRGWGAGQTSGSPGTGNGYDGQGRGFSGPAGGTVAGPYGGNLGGPYGTTGGLSINPGRIAGGLLGGLFGPIGSALGSLAGGWASNQLGGNFTIGGTDNRIGAGLGIGSGGGPVSNGGGLQGRGNDFTGSTQGNSGTQQGAPGTPPAPSTPPAGMPRPTPNTLTGLYWGGGPADPFAGRFGINPGLMPYLIAASQPIGQGYLSGIVG